jgi:hypothetical protein
MLATDGTVAPGWVGIALVVPGTDTVVVVFRARAVERVLDKVGRELKMPPEKRSDPGVHRLLWRALCDLSRIATRTGNSGAPERLGRNALWLALNTPGGEVRRQFDGLLAEGAAPHVTVEAAAGELRCAVGPRFDGAEAQAAARAFAALAAAPAPGRH